MNTRPPSQPAASFADELRRALTVALTGAPDELLRANLVILIGFAILLLAAIWAEKTLTRTDTPRAYRHHDHNHDGN